MTNKEIVTLASEDGLYFLEKIKFELDNMCNKTVYEQKIANQRIKDYMQQIKEL